ncbi:hypothetical protein D1818_12975 [Aquimarina sp. BL5]|uniref:hypothetical protein n=1 Tax=Aquimarina sp. BL5 TaxID=1714860 RepID=UPI000E47F14C|nr:hypothetical protein [Aquimarina sp. BL5]AXT51708.1 hypothetical protein D1818_12975 [Aquimarina sp. BL5]RKN08800.1 hypothetical protein D7036_05260 [Aquimarina sp. BL5]
MKNYTLLLLFAFICCKSESKPSNNLNGLSETDPVETVDSVNEEESIIVLTQKTYAATQKDKNGDFTQKLSVSWLSEDTIQYTLVFENQYCKKTTIGGKATALKPGKEPFMNSYKGASFEVKKYQENKQGYKIVLHIDSANKDKAAVNLSLTEDGENEGCKPSSIVMVAQN